MKPLKIYIGTRNKFVLCEEFPNDEEHAGLHDMLDFFYLDDEPFICHQDDNGNFTNQTYDPGFYLAHFSLENNYLNDPTDDDTYLIVDKVEKL